MTKVIKINQSFQIAWFLVVFKVIFGLLVPKNFPVSIFTPIEYLEEELKICLLKMAGFDDLMANLLNLKNVITLKLFGIWNSNFSEPYIFNKTLL